MSDGKTHYEILGLTSDATAQQVKKRFRELAKKYHPDVNRSNPAAHEIFLRVNEAYEVLNDPSRRAAYDLNQRDKARRAGGASSAPPGGYPPPGSSPGSYRPPGSASGPGYPGGRSGYQPPPGNVRFGDTYATPGSPSGRPGSAGQATPQRQAELERERRERDRRRQELGRMMNEARNSYQRGHIREAQRLCEQVLQVGRVGPAHELMGDILARQGHLQEAASHYTVAAQMTSANGFIMAKFNRVTQRLQGGDLGMASANPQKSMSFQLGVSCLGFALVVFLMFWSPTLPSNKEVLNWPFVPNWSFGQLIFMAADGFLAGVVLAVAGWLGQPEHEIIFPTLKLGRFQVRVWVALLLLSLLSFPLAVAVYLGHVIAQRGGSKAVLGLMGVAGFLVFGFALLHDSAAFWETLFFGGNVIFTMSILGWFIGDLFRPSWTSE